jgi:hypothetical protein
MIRRPDEGRGEHENDEAAVPDASWGRLQIDVDCALRRGAWYRVISLTPAEVVLNVSGQAVTVERRLIEIRAARPRRWTVVRQPPTAAALGRVFRDQYGVCPRCHNRCPLPRPDVTEMRCPRCETSAEVAWDERYLGRKTPRPSV